MSRGKTNIVVIFLTTIIALTYLITTLPSCINLSTNKLCIRGETDDVASSIVSWDRQKESNIYNLSLTHSLDFSLKTFYDTDLTKYPEDANKLSPFLTKRADVIIESQRIHMNIFSRLLKGYKFAMLFNYSPFENKGDSAIVVGETLLLQKMNINVIFACSVGTCRKHLEYAENISKQYANNELIILFHGGGNVIGYSAIDYKRFEEISHFKTFNIIMFPQGVFYRGDTDHIELCKKMYSSHPSLTFIWRDTVSYDLGKKLFPKVRSLLSPDIAYQIGPVKRFMNPTHDILWLKRTDSEKADYDVPRDVGEYRTVVADWRNWPTPRGNSLMENTYLMATTGLMFLSRGRIVVTDRLHGYILCTLLNILHVYIDNSQRKISNYHHSWTHGLENVLFANSSEDAFSKAKYLIQKLDSELPKITGFYKNTNY